jgi:hypothetical protein
LILAIFFLFPQQKDKWFTENLEAKVVPFLIQNDIKFFSDESSCKQIRYGTVEAASPKGCAYRENISDPTTKTRPDFSGADETLFDMTTQILKAGSPKKIVQIGTEYTRYDAPNAPRPPEAIGTAFYVSCFFCRTRYVYWPDYEALPQNWDGEISYTPINKSWFRVNEDWN